MNHPIHQEPSTAHRLEAAFADVDESNYCKNCGTQCQWCESKQPQPLPARTLAIVDANHAKLMAALDEKDAEIARLTAAAPVAAQPVAFMTVDGRVSMRATVESCMPFAARSSFNIPLYPHPIAQPVQPASRDAESLREIRRVSACLAEDWPDLESDTMIVRHFKWMARTLTDAPPVRDKLTALRHLICSAWITGTPDFRRHYDALLLGLYDCKNFDDLYAQRDATPVAAQPVQPAVSDGDANEVIVVQPTPTPALLVKADKIASALRGSRVNYAVEQDAAATIWELIDVIRVQPTIGHDSDCSTHNEPACPAGPCDCRLATDQEKRKAHRKDIDLIALLQAQLKHAKESAEYMETMYKTLPVIGVFAALEDHEEPSAQPAVPVTDAEVFVMCAEFKGGIVAVNDVRRALESFLAARGQA